MHTPARSPPQLVLSWHMGAATMCEYSRDEFVSGLQRLGADSVDKLKQRLPAMRAELGEPAKWRDIYNYAFDWAKEVRRARRG